MLNGLEPKHVSTCVIIGPEDPVLTVTQQLAAVNCMQAAEDLSDSDKAATAGSEGTAQPSWLSAGVSKPCCKAQGSAGDSCRTTSV